MNTARDIIGIFILLVASFLFRVSVKVSSESAQRRIAEEIFTFARRILAS